MISIIIGILGVVIGAVCAVFAYFQIREARRIAASSGSFKSPQLVVRYGALPLSSEEGRTLKLVYGMPKDFKREYVGILRMLIENTGTRAAENVKLEIVVPAGANRVSEFLEGRPAKGILPGVIRECFRIEELLHVYYYFPIINPGETLSVNEPFWIETTVDIPFSTVVSTADKKRMKLKGAFTIAFVFQFVLFHKEDLPWSSKVEIYVVEEQDSKRLINRWVTREAKRDGPFPAEGKNDAQVQWLMTQLEQRDFLLVLPNFEPLKITNKRRLLWENFDKSERWLLSRKKQKWEVVECEWTFR